MLLMPRVFMADARHKWRWALALGAVLSLALMTKLSALVLLAALGLAAGGQLALRPGSWRSRFARLKPWLLVPAVMLLATGWYFARNQRREGKLFVTSFDCKERSVVERSDRQPYWRRRPLEYYVGFTSDIYRYPYWPSGIKPRSLFFPVLLASTFCDYYDFYFSPPPRPGEPTVPVFRTPIRRTTLWLSCASVVAGTLVALATWAALLLVLWRNLRERRPEQWLLPSIPPLALLALLHFVTQYPFDNLGVVKGNYLLFAAPPLYACFGVALQWCWRRAWIRPLTVALALALVVTGAYSLYCRFG
jgi:4-amino-4-deoxy-L-arabinose transferase-like glycosyltransferase